MGDIKKIFEKEEDYYTLVKVSNFWNTYYKEYENKGDRNKNLSIH